MVVVTGTTGKCSRQPLGLTTVHSIKHQIRKNTTPFLKASEKPPTRPLHSPRLATLSWPWKTTEGLQSHKHIIQTRLQKSVWITGRKPVRESLPDLRSWWSSAERGSMGVYWSRLPCSFCKAVAGLWLTDSTRWGTVGVMLKDLKTPGEPRNISELPSQCIRKMCLETSSEIKNIWTRTYTWTIGESLE